MSRLVSAFVFALCCAPAVQAQEVRNPEPRVIPHSFIVTFAQRSFDLEQYRAAIYASRPAHEVDAIVRELDAAVVRDQADFVRAVTTAGGRVTRQFWIINAAVVELRDGEGFLRSLPNVARVEQDRIVMPWLDVATNNLHHGGDAANQRTINGVFVRGNGNTIAILDTGIDANTSNLGRPHRAFYPAGDPTRNGGGINGSYIRGQFDASGTWGTEDQNGHGTFVAGCAAANKWIQNNNSADDAFAPEAQVYNINVSSAANGGAAFSSIAAAWQHVASVRVAQNITVANNSYSGSPDMTNSVQVALDSVAFNSNVLVCVAAGNSNLDTSNSQSAYNGLAVGSIEKGTLQVSSFSCKGPLNGTQRTYPDIAAVGQRVNSIAADGEGSVSTSDGTSFASPMVAGAAALVRQARPALTALEVKAILLNNTTPTNNRNFYGLGLLRADNAVDAALNTEVTTVRLTSAAPRKHIRITSIGTGESVTATWFRSPTGTHENIDIDVYQSNGNIVASDLNTLNAYGKVTFQPVGASTFRAEVYLVTPGSGKTYDVAVAGHVEAINAPVITTFTPASYSVHSPTDIVVDGTDLDFVRSVTIGGQPVANFTSVSKTQLRFRPPTTLGIGRHNVVITTEVGVTAPTPIDATGTHPVSLTGPSIIPRGTTGNFTVYGERGWATIIMLSTSNIPTIYPGIVDLEIGNLGTSLWDLLVLVHNNQGIATFSVPVHSLFPRWAHYFEAVSLDPLAPTFPLETSFALQWNAQ